MYRDKLTFYNGILIGLILFGFALRANYLIQSHPYIDEYYTILAAEMIQQQGYPLLPSGLFYSHGFLYSYLMALLGGLFKMAGSNIAQADMVYRIPNLLISPAAMAMLFAVTRRWFGGRAALFAVAMLAVYPHAIVWGARVRMYALVFLFVPLLAYAFYRLACRPADKRGYGLTLLLLLVAILVHNWVVFLTPVLLLGAALVGWGRHGTKFFRWRWWLPGLAAVAVMVMAAVSLQSFGLAVPEDATADGGSQRILDATLGRLNPLSSLSSNGDLLRVFVWGNGFNLLLLMLTLAGMVGLWWLYGAYQHRTPNGRYFWPMLYLYVLLGGVTAEMALLIKPSLKQPRFVAPLLILAFIIVAGWLSIGLNRLNQRLRLGAGVQQGITIGLVLLIAMGGWWLALRQLPKIFHEGLPALAYERAFQFVRRQSLPEEPVVTPLPVAAYLYLSNSTYFAAQNANHMFVQPNAQGILADRWLGVPWLQSAQQLKETLQTNPRVWLVIDQLSWESQFNSDWKQVMRHNTVEVWAEDGVRVFKADGLTHDTPTQPQTRLDIQLGEALKLVGYSQTLSPQGLRLALFWQASAPLAHDYTTFLHVRDQSGQTIAQVDVQPLDGQYPTTRWKVGEQVVDEITLPLPPDFTPGTYHLLLGMYQWETLERLPILADTSGENAIELEPIKIPPHE